MAGEPEPDEGSDGTGQASMNIFSVSPENNPALNALMFIRRAIVTDARL